MNSGSIWNLDPLPFHMSLSTAMTSRRVKVGKVLREFLAEVTQEGRGCKRARRLEKKMAKH